MNISLRGLRSAAAWELCELVVGQEAEAAGRGSLLAPVPRAPGLAPGAKLGEGSSMEFAVSEEIEELHQIENEVVMPKELSAGVLVTRRSTARKPNDFRSVAIALVALLVGIAIGASMMWVLMSSQQRQWVLFSTAAQDWIRSQGLNEPVEVGAICENSSQPSGYVEINVGQISQKRAHQLYDDLATRFDLKPDHVEWAAGGFAGSGKWGLYRVEGYLVPEDRHYSLGLTFDPLVCPLA